MPTPGYHQLVQFSSKIRKSITPLKRVQKNRMRGDNGEKKSVAECQAGGATLPRRVLRGTSAGTSNNGARTEGAEMSQEEGGRRIKFGAPEISGFLGKAAALRKIMTIVIISNNTPPPGAFFSFRHPRRFPPQLVSVLEYKTPKCQLRIPTDTHSILPHFFIK
jgi:hypothetical protein